MKKLRGKRFIFLFTTHFKIRWNDQVKPFVPRHDFSLPENKPAFITNNLSSVLFFALRFPTFDTVPPFTSNHGKSERGKTKEKEKYNYSRKVKKLHKKLISLPRVKCPELENAWDSKKSYRQNMDDMGLANDPNASLGNKKRKNTKVVSALEAGASTARPKVLRLPMEPVRFCVYMIEKHGEDYEAMFRDPRNYYQLTSKQIQKKILKFKSVPVQWNAYLRAKGLLPASEGESMDLEDIMNKGAPMES